MTAFQRLVIRGLMILIRMQYSPRGEADRNAHFDALTKAIEPWERDATAALEQPEELRK